MSLRSIRRDVNSSVSVESISTSFSGSSNICSGGKGESGKSTNNGACFSLVTRGDLRIVLTGGSIWSGGWSSKRFLLTSTTSSRFMIEAVPMRLSCLSCKYCLKPK